MSEGKLHSQLKLHRLQAHWIFCGTTLQTIEKTINFSNEFHKYYSNADLSVDIYYIVREGYERSSLCIGMT